MATLQGNAYGPGSYTVSGHADELLAGTQPEPVMVPITIASTVTDSGNSPTTTLRWGTILRLNTSTGKYVAFDATGHEQNSVILTEDVDMLGGGSSAVDRVVSALRAGRVKKSKLIENGGTRGTLTNFDTSKTSGLIVEVGL